jgi:hypothetical protein
MLLAGRPNFNFRRLSESQAKRICYFVFDFLLYQNPDLTQPILLVVQCHQRIYLNRPPRWQVARYDCNPRQEYRHR